MSNEVTVRVILDEKPWQFTLTYDSAGDTEPSAVLVQAPKGTKVTADKWRRLTIGTALGDARVKRTSTYVAGVASAWGDHPTRPHADASDAEQRMIAYRNRLVVLYHAAVSQQLTAKQVAEAIGGHFGVSYHTAERWITEARREGHLNTYTEERRIAAARDVRNHRARGLVPIQERRRRAAKRSQRAHEEAKDKK